MMKKLIISTIILLICITGCHSSQEKTEDDFVMDKDELKQIKVTVYPSLSDCNLLYSSEDETVATVDYFGVVHALSSGETTITIKDSDKEDCAVTVTVKVK